MRSIMKSVYEREKVLETYSASSLDDEPIAVRINGRGRVTRLELLPEFEGRLTAVELLAAVNELVSGLARAAEVEIADLHRQINEKAASRRHGPDTDDAMRKRHVFSDCVTKVGARR